METDTTEIREALIIISICYFAISAALIAVIKHL
jgi:hypothetical protein